MPYELSLESLRRHYVIDTGSLTKNAGFLVTTSYTNFFASTQHDEPGSEKEDAWNKITPKLILGKIPFTRQDTLIKHYVRENCNNEKLAATLTVTKHFEIFSSRIHPPYQWNCPHYLLPITDETADVEDDNIFAALQFIRDRTEAGVVYVHCKAGKGRSAMILALYLYFFHEDIPELKTALSTSKKAEEKVESIEKYLRNKRKQVKLNDLQKRRIADIIETYTQFPVPIAKSAIVVNPNINNLLSSLALKTAIIHFSAFKKLAAYACINTDSITRHKERAQHIQNLFTQIYEAENANWYINLIRCKGPIQELLKANPHEAGLPASPKSDKAIRQKLYQEFLKELNQHLMNQYQLTIKKIVTELSIPLDTDRLKELEASQCEPLNLDIRDFTLMIMEDPPETKIDIAIDSKQPLTAFIKNNYRQGL